ncbi:MAG: endonuclease/exonuclease/phosphatase family protein [Actinomycetaceae bacterium]|nr:endonuclease/exonuclease/phosphatase family protein [Actinomycetaceae bacterium]
MRRRLRAVPKARLWGVEGKAASKSSSKAQSAARAVPGGLRILTLNLQYGTPAGGYTAEQRGVGLESYERRQNATIQAIEKSIGQISELDPDIICLQEVDKSQRRSGYVDQGLALAKGLNMSYYRLAATYAGSANGLRRLPLDSTIPATKGNGVAILSRWPVRSWHMKRLGRRPPAFRWSWGEPLGGKIEGKKRLLGYLRALPGLRITVGQTRAVLAANIITPVGEVACATTHLELHVPTASGQLRRAWRSVRELNQEAAILAGDFNLSPQQAKDALELLGDSAGPTLQQSEVTFPAWRPQHSVDQVLSTGWVQAASPRTVRFDVSDHLGLVVDLRPER